MTAALQEALTKLKAQEREMSARAEASERLSGEIVESLTAGLLVVSSEQKIRILNPAGRRMLNLPESACPQNYRDVLREFVPLAARCEECLSTGRPIVRRTLEIRSSDREVTHLGVSVSPLSDEHRPAPRRDLPVHRSHAGHGNGRAASPERQPRAGRRADRRHRARIPQRARDDSRVRASARSERAAGGVPAARGRHPARKPRRWARS